MLPSPSQSRDGILDAKQEIGWIRLTDEGPSATSSIWTSLLLLLLLLLFDILLGRKA